MKISVAHHRLLFKQPFTTAHGTRDGTDSVFVRIDHQGFAGHGEATLPPYVKENVRSVEAAIRELRPFHLNANTEWRDSLLDPGGQLDRNAPARNAVTMAALDLLGQMKGHPLWQMLGIQAPPGRSKAMVTLATKDPSEVAVRFRLLPHSAVLKVKLGSNEDLQLVKRVKDLDDRPLLLDGNQGIQSVDRALELIAAAGGDLVGIEQPFHVTDVNSHARLKRHAAVAVIGDESIQGLDDLRSKSDAFSAVNIKLIKCGGIDKAMEMARECQRLGLGIMLGSMSESSLGCLAMYHLAAGADLIDLDGPWLIGNDPFSGMELLDHSTWTPTGSGIGAEPRAELEWTFVGI
jgi:L-alanine-DL-glutamate epimerase-like enolase superfamily enzyme